LSASRPAAFPEITANYLPVKSVSVSGLQVSDYRDRDPRWMRRLHGELFDFYLAGKIKPVSRRRTLCHASPTRSRALAVKRSWAS
jgi:hypothetical protein